MLLLTTDPPHDIYHITRLDLLLRLAIALALTAAQSAALLSVCIKEELLADLEALIEDAGRLLSGLFASPCPVHSSRNGDCNGCHRDERAQRLQARARELATLLPEQLRIHAQSLPPVPRGPEATDAEDLELSGKQILNLMARGPPHTRLRDALATRVVEWDLFRGWDLLRDFCAYLRQCPREPVPKHSLLCLLEFREQYPTAETLVEAQDLEASAWPLLLVDFAVAVQQQQQGTPGFPPL